MNRKFFRWKRSGDIDLRIPLPGNNTLYVEVGDTVNPEDKLFRTEYKKIVSSYHLPSLLGVKTEKVKEYVGRINGEYISQGDLLAERLLSGGLVSKRILAGSDGIVSLLRLGSGYIDILAESEDKLITSPVRATVKEITLNNYIALSAFAIGCACIISKNLERARSSLTDQICGELEIIGTGDSVYTDKDLKENYSGKVVFAGRYLPLDLLVKIYERDCALVLTYSMDYLDYKKTEMPVVVVGGFGQITLPKEFVAFIRKCVGKQLVVSDSEETYLYFISDEPTQSARAESFFIPQISKGDFIQSLEGSSFGSTGEVLSVDPEESVDYIVVKDLRGKTFLLDQDAIVAVAKTEKL